MHPYLAALERLKNCVDYWRDNREKLCDWFSPSYGICLNSEYSYSETKQNLTPTDGEFFFNRWVDDNMEGWPESHSSLTYPVGGFNEYQCEHLCNTIWENEKRLRLLDYLIEKAKELE